MYKTHVTYHNNPQRHFTDGENEAEGNFPDTVYPNTKPKQCDCRHYSLYH
jgi:hypothetical protein